MSLTRFVPMAEWLPRYDRSLFTSDLIAAVIVTIMLIPQSLAYAMLAGLPPEIGLYASMLPLLGYAVFGTSKVMAVGPVAVVSLMTAAAVGEVAAPGSPEAIGAALVLAMISGLFLALLGVLRLGALANFLSHPVISGFIAASAVLIALSQLKHIFGIPLHGHTAVELLQDVVAKIGDANGITVVIGVGSLAALLLIRSRAKPLLIRLGLPAKAADIGVKAGPVLVVILATAAVAMLRLDEGPGVAVVGSIPAGLPSIGLPPMDWELWRELLPAAVLISVVGFVESVSVASSLAAKKRRKIDPNQELIGLGAANILAGVSSGYPVTGGFARSGVSFAAGAETPLSGVFTAVLIGVTVLFLTPLFFFLPNAVLAATIVVAVLALIDFSGFVRLYTYSKADFSAMAATVLVVLAVGIEAGILTGILVSLALYLHRTSRPHIAVVGRVPGTEHFRNILRHHVVTSPTVLAIRVDESLYFANARYLEDHVGALVADHPDARSVLLICSAVNLIDASALESLERIVDRLRDSGLSLALCEVKGPVMDRLKGTGLLEHLQAQPYLTTLEAMRSLDPSFDAPDRPAAA